MKEGINMSIINENAKINIKSASTNSEEMASRKKLRVFEAFAGIGAQAAAFKRMNINYEIVGISDWFIDAIECYAATHAHRKIG